MLEIKRIRTERGMAASELARRTNIDAAHLWRIENGQKSPTTRTLDKIADALDVDTGDLFPRTRRLATTA